MIRDSFFLIFGFNEETPQIKGQKGTTAQLKGKPTLILQHMAEELESDVVLLCLDLRARQRFKPGLGFRVV